MSTIPRTEGLEYGTLYLLPELKPISLEWLATLQGNEFRKGFFADSVSENIIVESLIILQREEDSRLVEITPKGRIYFWLKKNKGSWNAYTLNGVLSQLAIEEFSLLKGLLLLNPPKVSDIDAFEPIPF